MSCRYPPAPVCPQCHSSVYDWVDAGDHGTLFTWTKSPEKPIIAVVELDAGPRIISALEVAGEPVIGQRLERARPTSVELSELLKFCEPSHHIGVEEAE